MCYTIWNMFDICMSYVLLLAARLRFYFTNTWVYVASFFFFFWNGKVVGAKEKFFFDSVVDFIFN